MNVGSLFISASYDGAFQLGRTIKIEQSDVGDSKIDMYIDKRKEDLGLSGSHVTSETDIKFESGNIAIESDYKLKEFLVKCEFDDVKDEQLTMEHKDEIEQNK